MPIWMLFVLHVFATYRVVRFVTDDTLISKQRRWIMLNKQGQFRNKWVHGLICAWCFGFWCSVGSTALLWYLKGLPLPILWGLAVSFCIGYLGQTVDSHAPPEIEGATRK